jgi:hypothetical protein
MVLGRCQEEIIGEWRLRAGELLREQCQFKFFLRYVSGI